MIARFAAIAPHADRASAALPADHPAVTEGRTVFTSTVVSAAASPRLLVSGHNSGKIGARVMKGPWRGLPIFTLTLEERATCPRSCTLWRECYGNAMHFARRHRHGPALVQRLGRELAGHLADEPRGIVVRLHVLGDFWNAGYVAAWAGWMRAMPALRVFGYTAWPRASEIGAAIAALNAEHPTRWRIRFSGDAALPAEPLSATTIWQQPTDAWVPEGLVCPAQTHRTAACATCGLCWNPAMDATRIVFIGHGRRNRGPKRAPKAPKRMRIAPREHQQGASE